MKCDYDLRGGPLGHSAKKYINYGERNIHVWGSTSNEAGFVLIGGVYSNGDLTFGDVCDMLQRLLVVPPIYPPGAQIIDFALMALPGCPVPIDESTQRPRTNFRRSEVLTYIERYTTEVKRILACMRLPQDHKDALARPSDRSFITVQSGGSPSHFVCLIKVRYSEKGRIHETVLLDPPVLIGNPIVNRKGPGRSTAPETGNKSATRSDKTRKAVRERDSICRVTGSRALPRMRGTNYTGFEVAHIFPLAWAVPDVASKFHPLIQPYLTLFNADKPRNALLLRADVHSQFDEYQFSAKSVYLPNAHSSQPTLVWWLMRFEQSGASSLPNRDQPDYQRLQRRLYGPATTLNIPDFDPVLMEHHFTVALNWHVLGFGREAE